MYCDEHGTLDYCPECLTKDKKSISESNFEDWWELKGKYFKNEPGENMEDTLLPFRVAKAAWDARRL